ncbi:MAG TPA: cytochrome c [Usitatibacter sp.]|nr:cytochrome c [Usitatibacter sp.]
MSRSRWIAATIAVTAAVCVHAQQLKPEDQVKQRRAGYAVMGHNFASLTAMAQEKKPYNRDEAIRNAELVAALCDYMKAFFGEGTDHGGDTKAKPEVWQKRADFDDKMDKMIVEARKLPAAARADLPALKKAVADAGKACKACHDDYRAK